MHIIRCFGLIMSFVRGGVNFFYIDFRGGQTFFVLTQGGHGIFRRQDCRYWDFGGKSPTCDGIQGKNEPGPGMEDPLPPLQCQYGKQSINRSYTIMPYFLYILFIVMLQTTGCKTTNSLKKATILRKIKQQESPYSLRHRLAAIQLDQTKSLLMDCKLVHSCFEIRKNALYSLYMPIT